MVDITFLKRNELAKLGFDAADSAKLIDLRVRFGTLVSSDMIERLTNTLSANGVKALKAAMRDPSPVRAQEPLPSLILTLIPNPPMRSAPGMTLTIRLRRHVDDEDFEAPIPFTLGGETRLPIMDVNLAHLISYQVKTAVGEIVAERVLAPVESRGELRGTAWVATPPLVEGETAVVKSGVLTARLFVDTLRPAATPPKPATPAPLFARSGKFVVIGQPNFGFTGYALSAALATPALLSAIADTLDTSGGNTAAQARFAPTDARFGALLAALPLVAGEIDYAGGFRLRQEGSSLTGIEGWVWVLTGPDAVVGFRPDATPAQPAPEALIFLNADLAQQPSNGLPTDATEASLLARPDLFSDDPGSSCRPFSSPGRILGEKRFRTVLRVTQPQVARAGLTPISFEDQSQRPVEFPRRGVDPNNPIEYEVDPSRFQAQSVAFGHVIEHVVRYRSNGYSLGNVAHSLTLAPREKRRVMKVEFSRIDKGSRDEDTQSADEVKDGLDSQHSYDDVVSGALNEWSRGSSSAMAGGFGAGVGALLGPVVLGGGVSGGGSQSDASQQSHRDTMARESQNLRDSIRRYGESLRKLESTVVTETSQSETVTGTSEVVQNINYTRALSIVYYEILRHLRVDTEVGAVSECLFVPMPVLPFTDERIARHRKILSRFARGTWEKSVFHNLDDIQRDFVGSDVPRGFQADHPLTYLSGSLTIKMSIEMPAGGTATGPATTYPDGQLLQTSAQLETAWQPFADLIPMPVPILATTLASLRTRPQDAERLFRTQIAPTMARGVLDKLTLSAGQAIEAIDFTLASSYVRGQPLRVDFDVTLDGTLTRRQLEHMILRLDPKAKLPKGSWVNLTGATINFATRHYKGSQSASGSTRDLIDPVTGVPHTTGAQIDLLCTDTDNLDLQKHLREGYQKLKQALAANPFRYHKAIWKGIDRDELYALLDGYAISPTDGRSIASVIDPTPLGILGNSLVFATRTTWPLDESVKTFADLKARYTSGSPVADPIRISLPTSGLYARAHMDECIAAEEHNGSFDWVFDSTEPELADFPTGMFASRAMAAQGLSPTPLPETIINLQNAPAAPAPTGLASTLAALGTEGFRDITGLAGTQENLRAAMANATSLAASGMSQGAKLAELASDARAGKDINALSAALQKAVKAGILPAGSATQSLTDMAARKGGGGQPPASDLHERALESDGEVTHSSTESDGTTKTTTKKAPVANPDPTTDVFVVPIPRAKSPQVLFLNFATAKSELRPKHVEYLRHLAAIIGVKVEDVVSIEGHASNSGSEKSNEEIGEKRALAIFNELHRLVSPLGANPDYTPDKLKNSGEVGSFRGQLAGNAEIDRIKGADHPNDPVEKAVLVTLRDGVDLTKKPESVKLGNVDITYMDNYIYVGDDTFCSAPDGTVTQFSGNTMKVLSDNETKVQIGDTTLHVSLNFLNNISFSLFSGNSFSSGNISFSPDSGTGTVGTPVVTPPLADQLRDNWMIKLFDPEIPKPTSMMDVLTDLAKMILSLPTPVSLPASPHPLLETLVDSAKTLVGNGPAMSDSERAEALVDVLIDELGLDKMKAILGMIRFGQITMRGQIKAEDSANNSFATIEGLFTGTGIIVGATGSSVVAGQPSRAVILDNASYMTKEKRTLNSWEHSRTKLREFAYIDNGAMNVVGASMFAAATLTGALEQLVKGVMPDLIGLIADAAVSTMNDVLGQALETLNNYGPSSTVRFTAFEGDAKDQIKRTNAGSSGIEGIRIVAIAPDQISFTKT
ncbi:hypothetical protein C0V76_00040 [Uliginosibacterium sp. TH139]|nr:hypothetical protein C0V76_00040 [Uliginosibacterium sp. TH139]